MDVELDDDHAVQPMGSLQQDQKEEEEEIEANKNEDWNDFVCRTISESGWGSGDDDLVNSITELTRRDPCKVASLFVKWETERNVCQWVANKKVRDVNNCRNAR
eukprot:933016_1